MRPMKSKTARLSSTFGEGALSTGLRKGHPTLQGCHSPDLDAFASALHCVQHMGMARSVASMADFLMVGERGSSRYRSGAT